MSEWKECTIGDLGTVVGGATPLTSNSLNYENGKIAWITPKDLSNYNERYISHGERNITEAGMASCAAQLLPKHSVLFSSRAPIGYVAIASNEVCTNQGFKSVIPNKKVDYLFLYYLLKYNKDKIEGMGSGTTFKEVSKKTMEQVKVRVPVDILEQQKIANILDSLDAKIELNNQINRNLEEQAQALFKNYEENKAYCERKICDVAEINPDSYRAKDNWSFVNYLDTSNITQNAISEIQYIDLTVEKLPSRAKRKVVLNDIIYSTVRPNQRHYGIIGEVKRNMLVSTGFAVIRSKNALVSNEYLYLSLIQNDIVERLQQIAEQSVSTFPAIKPSDIGDCLVKIYAESDSILLNNQLSFIFKEILQNNQENKHLAILRDSLLPKLMSGEIDMANITD